MAVALFTEARPPGIYKQDYLDKLYNMYVKDEESREMIQVMIRFLKTKRISTLFCNYYYKYSQKRSWFYDYLLSIIFGV